MKQRLPLQDKTISLKFISNLKPALSDHPSVFTDIQALFNLPVDIQEQDRMPLVKFIHLFQVLQNDYGITDIGYRLGVHYTPALMGTLGLYLQTSETLGEAIYHYLDYAYLDAELDVPLQLILHENTFSIKFVPPSDLLAIQGTYAVIRANRVIKTIQYFCASDVIPLFINANLKDEHMKFPRTISVMQAPNSSITLTYSNESLKRKLPGRNKTLNQLLKLEVEKLINQSRKSEDIISNIIYHLTSGDKLSLVSLSSLAKDLAMSERTLSRKLKDKGVQLKDMLIHAKKHFAIKALSSGMDISEVANKLGLSDRSSFERAFKSWTNFTPAQFKGFNQAIPQLAQQNNLIHTDSLAAVSHIQINIEKILTNKNDTNQIVLAKILEKDPILNAKIYGLSQRVHFGAFETSQTADALLYLKNSHITKGMLSSIINNSFVNQYNFSGIDLDEHWQEAFIMSQFAQAVFSTGKIPGDWNESEIHLLANTCHIGFIFLVMHQKSNMTAVFNSYDLNEFESLSFSQTIENQCKVSAFMISALIMTHWNFPLKFVSILKNMGCKNPNFNDFKIINLLRCADEIGYYTMKRNQVMVEKSIERLASNTQIEFTQLIEIHSKVKSKFLNLTKTERLHTQ